MSTFEKFAEKFAPLLFICTLFVWWQTIGTIVWFGNIYVGLYRIISIYINIIILFVYIYIYIHFELHFDASPHFYEHGYAYDPAWLILSQLTNVVRVWYIFIGVKVFSRNCSKNPKLCIQMSLWKNWHLISGLPIFTSLYLRTWHNKNVFNLFRVIVEST